MCAASVSPSRGFRAGAGPVALALAAAVSNVDGDDSSSAGRTHSPIRRTPSRSQLGGLFSPPIVLGSERESGREKSARVLSRARVGSSFGCLHIDLDWGCMKTLMESGCGASYSPGRDCKSRRPESKGERSRFSPTLNQVLTRSSDNDGRLRKCTPRRHRQGSKDL